MTEIAADQTINTVKYLYDVANIIPSSAPANILKSYYLTNCRKQTLNSTVSLPQQFLKTIKRCPRCCVLYENDAASYQIAPERRKNRFVRRLLRKVANQDNLTHFQRIYHKNLKHKGNLNAHNKLVITCGICKHNTREKLKKPEMQSNIEVEPLSSSISKSKKKKKKDRFSGLNQDVVLSVTSLKKPFNANLPIQTTPVLKKIVQPARVTQKKNKKQVNNNNQMETPHKKTFKSKERQKQKLKALQNILDKPKQKGSPVVSLKQFLTDL